jgi:hypothetical protein
MAVQRFQKRQIGFVIGLFNDVVEIAHGLMSVNQQCEGDFGQDTVLEASALGRLFSRLG